MKNFKDLGITNEYKGFIGDKKKMNQIINREIIVHDYAIKPSTQKPGENCLHLQFELGNSKHVAFTGSKPLMDNIRKIPPSEFPFVTTIVREKEWYEFT